MELEIESRIYYSNRERIPIKEIADSLLAIEGVASHVPAALEAMCEGLFVQRSEIFLETLKSGSLDETILQKLLIEFQQKLETSLEKLPNKLSFKQIKDNKKIVSWLILALVALGGGYAIQHESPTKPTQHIENTTINIFNIGSEITNIEAGALRELVENSIKSKASIAKDAVKFTRPAKNDNEASIKIGNHEISSEAISEIPRSYLLNSEDSDGYAEFEKTEIHIRATDLDSKDRGWGAIIPEFSKKRVRLHIAIGIKLTKIAAGAKVIGDVVIYYKTDEKGNMRAPQAHLYKVHEVRN